MSSKKSTIPKWAKSQHQLASILQVTRQTITAWSKDPSCPGCTMDGKYNVAEWIKWVRSNSKRTPATSKEWSQEIKKRQCAVLDFKLGILKRDYIPASKVNAIGAQLGSQLKSVATTLHLLAPSLCGLSVGEIEAMLRSKEDDVMRTIHELPEKIQALMETTSEEVTELEVEE